jgi:UPF0176 protein
MKYTVLLFYKYIAVPDPEAQRELQRQFCNSLEMKGRILIGDEGINATVAGSPEACDQYISYMNSHELFSNIEYKIDSAETMPFPRLRVKVRPEIVTLGVNVDPELTAPRLSAEEFNTMLERDDIILFDARNNYESAIGKFENAITPDIGLFKDLPAKLEDYANLKDKTIVTYCTGGIRCEKASALMRQRGFKDVYQLDGGIIKYAQKYPKGAFKGECFVFDERMSVAFSEDAEKLGSCHFCEAATNAYINCAIASCNAMVLICNNCKPSHMTCLSGSHASDTKLAGSTI